MGLQNHSLQASLDNMETFYIDVSSTLRSIQGVH